MDYVTSRRVKIEHNGFALSTINGDSMRPLIWGGQHCVAVGPVDGEPLIGDILVFMQKNNGRKVSIMHRLVNVRHEGDDCLYITRGDNCLACEQLRRAEIIGRVTEVHRISGYRPWHIIPSRQFTVNDRAYIRYTRIWTAIWPVRRLYYNLRGKVRALRSHILSIFNKIR